MKEKVSISQREHYQASAFTEFLWWLSTAEKELVVDAAADRNRFSIIGLSVLCTWVFATMAWTYFFSTVASDITVAIIGGLLMGFIILCIDRALIKGINQFNKNKLLPLFFRGLLAVTIGTFMAQPALLYMFRKEIKLQATADNEKKSITNAQLLDSLYKNRKTELLSQKTAMLNAADNKYQDVTKARNNFLSETDGSGGSGKVGIKDIAVAKRNEYQKLDNEYQSLLAENKPKLELVETALKDIGGKMEKEQQAFAQHFNDGFLTQTEALNHLIKDNDALRFRYYLLVVILVLIELMPVIAKMVIPTPVYDEKVVLRENMEKETASSNIQKEQVLKELYNSLALENDKEAITKFFFLTKEDREEKIKAFSSQWKQDNHQTFDGLWEKMKREILTKQEN
jgi:Domain of unknown function (DUF4407)